MFSGILLADLRFMLTVFLARGNVTLTDMNLMLCDKYMH